METRDLIVALGRDAKAKAPSPAAVLAGAGLAAIVFAYVLFAVLIGPRPDIAAAAVTPRFLFKFVVTLA
ncbi:MAG: NrsF family protein, partial [Mesorhizobium sp.]|nr:NrsF family protein [Mesorhizobium sp.]